MRSKSRALRMVAWESHPPPNAVPHSSLDSCRAVLPDFAIEGELVGLVPHHRGHIHDTFISTWSARGGEYRLLHQRMNDKVFTDIPALMHNVEAVTRHLSRRGAGEDGFETLQLVQTRLGKGFLLTRSGPWRTYCFVEDTTSYDLCESTERAFEAARAFGRFQADLIDLDASGLRETIPRFFSSPHRFQQFQDALASDPLGRAADCATEVRFASERGDMVHVIEERIRKGAFPLRVVHGDTKLNNVLFDQDSGKARCVVDLDTCMPSYSLYDFGDLVRFTAATSAEDETDMSKVGTDLGLYRALVNGYLESAGAFLTGEEIELMPFSARLVTLTIGLRFLADHLAGDVYFKVEHEGHNLERARVQFEQVACMERQQREMAVKLSR